MNKNIKIAKKLIKLAKNLVGGRFDDTLSINAGRFDDTLSINAGKFDDTLYHLDIEDIEKIKKQFRKEIIDTLDLLINEFKNNFAKERERNRNRDCWDVNVFTKIQKNISFGKIKFELKDGYDINAISFYSTFIDNNNEHLFSDESNLKLIIKTKVVFDYPNAAIYTEDENKLQTIINFIKMSVSKWIQKNKENIANTMIEEIIENKSFYANLFSPL